MRSFEQRISNQEKKKTKGWGKMVDTGFGGLNNLNPVDTKEFIKEEQKRNGKIKSHY